MALVARAGARRARALRRPRAIGVALRARGLLEQGEQRIATLRAAVEQLDRCPGRLERAATLTDLGRALADAGDQHGAQDALRAALAAAVAAGATAAAEQAVGQLARLGYARARRRDAFRSEP